MQPTLRAPVASPSFASDSSARPKRLTILGIPLAVVDMNSAVDVISGWVDGNRSRYVCAADVHSVMRAQDDPAHNRALCRADMVLPDGMPLVWMSKLRGQKDVGRVCGPDLMLRVFEYSQDRKWRHYFFGGSPGVADALANKAKDLYPQLIVAGTSCPPFRSMSPHELEKTIAEINSVSPDFVWVGLGCPKQEIWMCENVEKLTHSVAIGVGAAFDFHSGRISRAPRWMRSAGLEWMHRLISEPRRLWRRYLYLAPRFVILGTLELLHARPFSGPSPNS
jgi:N-acetylglucosaminyldiphosphoundecaprenol N-acetyl-beta-D-mannosaminyltransferase